MMPGGTTRPAPSSSESDSASIAAIVRVRRQVFQNLLEQRPTPERCIEAYHLCRSEFERAAEAKLRARALSGDGNIDLNLRDLRHEPRPVEFG